MHSTGQPVRACGVHRPTDATADDSPPGRDVTSTNAGMNAGELAADQKCVVIPNASRSRAMSWRSRSVGS
jgi:hypothetical protein